MGRPSLYSEDIANAISERLANGEPLKRICASEGMPDFSTVWRWERDKEEFRNLLARAREVGTHNLADECLEIADDSSRDWVDTADGPKLNNEHVQRSRLRIDTRMRLIGKWNAKAYGEKVTQEHQGPDGGPVQVSEIRYTVVRPSAQGD